MDMQYVDTDKDSMTSDEQCSASVIIIKEESPLDIDTEIPEYESKKEATNSRKRDRSQSADGIEPPSTKPKKEGNLNFDRLTKLGPTLWVFRCPYTGRITWCSRYHTPTIVRALYRQDEEDDDYDEIFRPFVETANDKPKTENDACCSQTATSDPSLT